MSKIAKGKNAMAVVFRDNKEKTLEGLKQTELMKNWRGKIVSNKDHAAGVSRYAKVEGWITAVTQARQALGVKGFQAVKKGTPLYLKAKEFPKDKKVYVVGEVGIMEELELAGISRFGGPLRRV